MKEERELKSRSLGEIIDEFTEEYIKLAEKMAQLAETLWSLWLREEGTEVEK